jgi:hypothetical protein
VIGLKKLIGTLQCSPLEVTEFDACSNIAGLQANPPANFHVDNGYCYPLPLTLAGAVTLTASPSPAQIGQAVTWTYTLNPEYFQGVYEGVTYQIPRNATVTWSGDISNSAFTSGNSGTSATKSLLSSSSPTGTRTVTYSEAGTARVTITINDGYWPIESSRSVFVQNEVGCPGSPGCIGNSLGVATIDDFSSPQNIVNEGGQCMLSWDTSIGTEVCTLITPSGNVSVATSTESYGVDPGTYSLTCHNGAEPPQVVTEGPISCILNPNVKER